ncbi:MAG: hypothetical protein IJ634_08315 [Bacteroidales bacterium]|nr:hypothetical protein [Bacteroidales bacterium]
MSERHRKKRLDAWRYLLALPRSAWYNLRLLPFQQARKLPILISHRTKIEHLKGTVVLGCAELRPGLVKIGFATYQGTRFRRDRTMVNILGTVKIKGECSLGAGCSIEVAEGAMLTVGDKFHLGPNSLLICHCGMFFGEKNRFSWNCTLMDTDQHALEDIDGKRVNNDRPISTGNNVWVGCHVIATKGVELADNTTVAAGARLAGRYEEPLTVLAGNPAVVVRRDVKRAY